MKISRITCTALVLVFASILLTTVGCTGRKKPSNPGDSKTTATSVSGKIGSTDSGETAASSVDSSKNDGSEEIYVPEKGLRNDEGEENPTTSKSGTVPSGSGSTSRAVSSGSTSDSEPITSNLPGDSEKVDDVFASKPKGFAGGVY